jgi:hypothetical protein
MPQAAIRVQADQPAARRRRARRALLLLLLGAALPAQAAEQHTRHAHQSVAIDPAMTLQQAVDAALRNYPRLVELAARDAQAEALIARGRSPFAGGAAVTARWPRCALAR